MTAKVNLCITAERRNAISTELLLRRLVQHHGVPVYPMPAVIAENPLVANYRDALPGRLARCETVFARVSVAVCHEFGLSKEQLVIKGRANAFPRQVAMHLMSKESVHGETMVARLFGRDKTCVLLANKKIPKLAVESKAFARRLRNLTVAVRAAA